MEIVRLVTVGEKSTLAVALKPLEWPTRLWSKTSLTS